MEELIKNTKTLMISSKDKDNNLNISYSTYVHKGDKLYIYISKIAKHYENLLENPNIAIMIIEDEKDSKTVFDRKRISLNCIANKIKDEDAQDIYGMFDERHGIKIMKILKTMDFNVFELKIVEGRYVQGFTRVFDVSIKNNEFILNAIDYKQHIRK